MLPRPQVGALLGFRQRAVRGLPGIYQRDIAIVRFGRLVEQTEHALRACHCHDHRVELLADLRDGLAEIAVQRHKRRQRAECQADIAVGRQRRARHHAQHIAQMAKLRVDRHQNIGKGICLTGADAQFFVQLAEAAEGLLLVIEHLDDLLALHHFFNITVDCAEVLLPADEVFAGLPGELLRHEEHHRDHDQRDQCQRHVQNGHADQHAHHADQAGKEIRQALAEELAQRVDVVRVDRHDVAVGMGVKIADGQALHMAEQPDAQVAHRSLRNVDHQPVVRPRGKDADGVDRADLHKLQQQRPEIRVAAFEHRQDIAVIELLQKERAVELRRNGGDHADDHAEAVPLVVLPDLAERASEDLAHFRGTLCGDGLRAARAAGSSFCHYASPAFSSKSPPPCVWPCQTS